MIPLPKSKPSLVATLGAILADSAAVLSVRVLGAIAAVATSIVIARYASVEIFGLYLFVMSCVSLGTLILVYGLDIAVLRNVPKYVALGQPDQLPHLLRWATRRLGRQAVAVFIVLIAVITTAIVASQVRSWPMSERFTLALLGASLALVGVLGCNAILRSFLQGLAYRWAFLPEQLLRPILLLAFVCSGVLLAIEPSATLFVSFSVLASISALGLAAFWAQREAQLRGAASLWSGSPILAADKERQAAAWSVGLSALFMLATAQLLLGQADLLVLGLLRGPTETGLYGSVVRVMAVLVFGLAALNAAFAPRIGQLLATGDIPALARLSRWLVGLALTGTTVLIVLFWFAAPWVLGLFGAAYVTDETLLAIRILLVAQLSTALAVSAGSILVMAGREKQAAVIALMAASINLVLNFALISRFGIVGAAAGTAVALCLQNITAWWFAQRSLLATPGR